MPAEIGRLSNVDVESWRVAVLAAVGPCAAPLRRAAQWIGLKRGGEGAGHG